MTKPLFKTIDEVVPTTREEIEDLIAERQGILGELEREHYGMQIQRNLIQEDINTLQAMLLIYT